MNSLLKLKHEFYVDGKDDKFNESTPDGDDASAMQKQPEVNEISKKEAEWLVEFYDIDQDGKLNLEEFAAIFMEKSQKFKNHYHLWFNIKRSIMIKTRIKTQNWFIIFNFNS